MADVFTQVVVHKTSGMTEAVFNTAVKTVLDAHDASKVDAINHVLEGHKTVCYIVTHA